VEELAATNFPLTRTRQQQVDFSSSRRAAAGTQLLLYMDQASPPPTRLGLHLGLTLDVESPTVGHGKKTQRLLAAAAAHV